MTCTISKRLISIASCGTMFLTLAGCPGDDGTGDSGDGGATTTGTSADDDGGPTSAGSMTSTSAGSNSASGDTTGGDDSVTTIGPATDSGSGSGDTGTAACDGLEEADCTPEAGCRGIFGRPYEMQNTGAVMWCLAAPEFVGCIPADTGCTEAETSACPGDDAGPYWFPDGCIPEFWFACPAPTDGKVPDCP
jgi:hypothetical protein